MRRSMQQNATARVELVLAKLALHLAVLGPDGRNEQRAVEDDLLVERQIREARIRMKHARFAVAEHDLATTAHRIRLGEREFRDVEAVFLRGLSVVPFRRHPVRIGILALDSANTARSIEGPRLLSEGQRLSRAHGDWRLENGVRSDDDPEFAVVERHGDVQMLVALRRFVRGGSREAVTARARMDATLD